MKNFGVILLLGVSLLWGNAFDLPAKDDKKKEKKTETLVFKVSMTCENCKKKIEKNVSWEKGVKDLRIDLEEKTVTILFDPRKTNKEALEKAIEKLGFTCEIDEEG
jgi:copper chaperone CopZ